MHYVAVAAAAAASNATQQRRSISPIDDFCRSKASTMFD